MSYKFILDGKLVTREEFAEVIYCLEQDNNLIIHELFETGSVHAESVLNEGNGDATLQIEYVPGLNKNTLKLALYSTLSYLLLDSADGTLPKKYTKIFEKLGKEIIDLDIIYEDALDQLIKKLEEAS